MKVAAFGMNIWAGADFECMSAQAVLTVLADCFAVRILDVLGRQSAPTVRRCSKISFVVDIL